MKRPVDWRQRNRARDPERSFIVQAPAGSGKTELLTQRMLVLLARVENPEEVVAITFTRKAAAEMAHRLFERLDAARINPDAEDLAPHLQTSHELALAVLENDARRGWNLLEQPGRLRVRTIDSLCSDLARQLPVLSGLGGGQQVTDDPSPLYLEAATRAMAAIESEADERHVDVARILDRYDNQYDRLVSLLTDMLGKRDQWQKPLARLWRGDGFDRQVLEQTLRELVDHELAEVAAEIPSALWDGLGPVLDYAVSNDPDDAQSLYAVLEDCAQEDGSVRLPADAGALDHWLTLVRRLLTAGGKSIRKAPDAKAGFPAPSGAKGEERQLRQHWKDDFIRRLDLLRAQDGLLERLETVLRLPRAAYEDEAWNSLQSLMQILLRSLQEWLVVMAESGRADFIEIADRARQALGEEGEPSEFGLRLDYRISHLLVDEFQDTSHGQIRLLERLTAGWAAGDGRTLFLVGDPMQSIYRFRKAEVSLFIQAFEGQSFQQLALEPVQLTVNFRSAAAIVDWVNAAFPPVMPRDNDPLKGAVRYSPSEPRPDAPADGRVEVALSCTRDDQAEAETVIERIRQGAAEESTAILVRSRKHAAAILAKLDALKQDDARYRYRAVQFNPLAGTALIRDLVSLTLALQQPADRLAWFSVLRAPFVGLDLADLDALAGVDGDVPVCESVDAGAEGDCPGLGPAGRWRLQRVAPPLRQGAGMIGRLPLRDAVETTWQALGGPACIANESELRDAATFFGLLERMERDGQPVDREGLDQQLENLWAEPDAQADGRLVVMTVYAAKGLEFDTVIMPGLNKETGSDGQKLMHWFELAERDRIVFSPMRSAGEREDARRSGDLVKFIAGVERQRQKLENGRLLYVAATRAIRRLYLFGDIAPNRNDEFRPAATTLLGELWPAVRAEQEAQLAHQLAALPDPGPVAENRPLPQRYRRLPADWKPPARPAPVSLETPDLPEPPAYIEFRWAGEAARLAGDLVHRLLQLIAVEGVEAWSRRGGFDQNEPWCRRQLRTAGIRGDREDEVVQRTARAIRTCLHSDTGRWLLADHESGACEYAVTALLDGRTVNLVLDRTFVENGERWIIDYKTGEHRGGDLEGFLESEVERYGSQLTRYREAMALSETRPIRTALYFPLLDRLVEL